MSAAQADGPDLVTPAEAVRVALQWQREGRLAEAGVLYERVLEVEPENAEALHFLGLLRHQLGAPREGIDCLRKAVALAPEYSAAHSNLGNMLLEQGDLEEAERAYRQALELAPDLIDAKNNLAMLLRRRGRPGEAEEVYREVIAQAPEHPLAYNNLGHLLADSGRLAEAVELLERAVRLHPGFAEAFRNLGHALTAQQRPADATRAYRRAVELGADAYLGLATALREQGLVDEAIAAFRHAIAIGGRQATAFHSLGMLLSARQREAEAIEVYEQWLRWDPGNPVARHMLAACRHQSVPERASNAYVEAVFDGFASVFDQRLNELEYRAPELVGELVRRRAAGAAGAQRILDAGCGTGLCGPLLRPYASGLTGVDLSARMLERARSLDCYDRLVRAELGAFLGGAEGEFDLIVSADTLVYFGELATILRAVTGALAPGGSLIATLERSEEAPAPGYRLNTHGRYSHSEGYVRSVCRDCGLQLSYIQREVLRQEMGQPVTGLLVEAVKAAGQPTVAGDRSVPG